jgi:hypothetical protein
MTKKQLLVSIAFIAFGFLALYGVAENQSAPTV